MFKRLKPWVGLKHVYLNSPKALPWLHAVAGISLTLGLLAGLFIAPADYQQGDAFRIIYVHVPSAFLSMMIYALMASYALIYLIWRIKLADVLMQAAAPIGAVFTACALITGSIWGKPMWGTWWVWDARLTAELILLFIYLGAILLRPLFTSPEQGAKALALWVLVGAIDLPIIHYSVYWWHTLHQGATISKLGKPAIAGSMLWPLLLMLVGCVALFAVMLIVRARTEILKREAHQAWVFDAVRGDA